MKNALFLLISFAVLQFNAQAQGFKNILKKDTSGKNSIQKIIKPVAGKTPVCSNDDIVNGLKEALSVGTNNASQKLSAADGFFKDAAVKISDAGRSGEGRKKIKESWYG